MIVPHVFACSSYRPQAPVEDTVVVPHFLACKLVSGVTLIRTAIVLFSVGKSLKVHTGRVDGGDEGCRQRQAIAEVVYVLLIHHYRTRDLTQSSVGAKLESLVRRETEGRRRLRFSVAY